MNRLDRLIKRLQYIPNVSLEDAFDIVKDYWEDVKREYWDDVDDELAEELGVTPIALRELLEVHRHTFEYANIGGNSSVRGYDHGEDWIVVMFSDGTRYLYTVKSTSPESIAHMKELALAGKGLNSYIMRLQRENYAGRNVKGEILIKPGMETFNPFGYQRLKLIEAFRNTMTKEIDITYPVFSNEDSEESIGAKMKDWLMRFIKWLGQRIVDTFERVDAMLARADEKAEEILEWVKAKWFTSYTVNVPPVVANLAMAGDRLDYNKYKTEIGKLTSKLDSLYTLISRKNKLDSLTTFSVAVAKFNQDAHRTKSELQKSWDSLHNGEERTLTIDKESIPDIKRIAEHGVNIQLSGKFREALKERQEELRKLLPNSQIIESIDSATERRLNDNIEQFMTNVEACVNLYNKHALTVLSTLHAMYKKAKAKESVSNEGIFDTLKRMFGSGTSDAEPVATPSEPVPKKAVYVWERAGEIEKSPPSTLGVASSNSPIFQLNGSYNPNWITRLEQDIGQYDRITKDIVRADKQVKAWVDKWDPILDEFSGDDTRKDEFIQVLRQWQAAEPKVWGETFRNNHEFLGWGKYRWEGVDSPGFGYYPLQPGPTVSIPALDANSTHRVIKLIAKLGQQILFGLKEDLTYVGYDFSDAPFRGYAFDNDVVQILNKIRYHAHASESPHDHYAVVERRLEIILRALVDYVETASNNSSGMEMYKQKLLKTYSQQIVDAGTDGLSPVSQELMAVGLESFGFPIKTSLESIDHEEIKSPTQRLFVSIESMISHRNETVSNEGIWGAIKYVFGGNYEDLPKINAAYAEAVDAVKSTYGNPQWVEKRRLRTGHRVKIKGYSKVADNPAGMLEKVRQNNKRSIESNNAILKNELEYLGKYTKFLTSSERNDNDKAQSLLDMFDSNFDKEFSEADDMDFGSPGDVNALDKDGVLKTAKVFEDAMKYRMETDLLARSGFKKMMYTDGGKERWGDDGTETGKLEGAAHDLAVAVGERFYSIQEDYYQVSGTAWMNADSVVKGCLMLMEASAD